MSYFLVFAIVNCAVRSILYKLLGVDVLKFLLGIYLRVQLLGYEVCEISILENNAKLFSKVFAPIYVLFRLILI